MPSTPILAKKLQAYGITMTEHLTVSGGLEQVAAALDEMRKTPVNMILCTGGTEPDRRSIEEAASLAAYYSQGREGGKVPVDYTPVKFVKKPAGGKPGMVVYTTYQTIYAVPDEALARRLSVR